MSATAEPAALGVARAVLCLGLVATALIFDTWTADAFGLPKMLAIWTMVILTAAAWVIACRWRQRWLPWGRFGWLALIHVAVVALATITSVSRVDSLIGSYERYGGLLSLALFVATALLVIGVYVEQPRRLEGIAWAVSASAVVLSAYLLVQAAGLDWIDWREPSGIPVTFQGGTMGNSDFAGGWLGISLPFLAFALARAQGRGRLRLALAAGSVATVAALVVTRSRGGILAALAGMAVLAAAHWRQLPRVTRWAGVAAAAVTVALAAVVLLVPGLGRSSGLGRSDLLRTKSVEIRGREWAAAGQVFVHHPVLGTGPDTFEYSFAKYRSRADGRELGLQIADKPHNVLLEHATDTGILGLGAYLALVVGTLAMAVRRIKSATIDPAERLLLVTFTAGFAAYLGQAMVSIDIPPLGLISWICLGAMAVLADVAALARRRDLAEAARTSRSGRTRGRGSRPARPARPQPRHLPAGGRAIAAGAGLLALGALWPLAADLAAGRAQRQHDRQVAATNWQRALGDNPLQLTYRVGAGFTDEARGAEAQTPDERAHLLTTALADYRRARQLAPRSIAAMLGLARTETLYAEGVDAGHFPAAEQWWQRLIAADPQDWEIHNSFGLMLNAWSNAEQGDHGLRTRAADELEQALRIKPDHVPALVNLAKIRAALGDDGGARKAGEQALRLDPGNADAKAVLDGLPAG